MVLKALLSLIKVSPLLTTWKLWHFRVICDFFPWTLHVIHLFLVLFLLIESYDTVDRKYVERKINKICNKPCDNYITLCIVMVSYLNKFHGIRFCVLVTAQV